MRLLAIVVTATSSLLACGGGSTAATPVASNETAPPEPDPEPNAEPAGNAGAQPNYVAPGETTARATLNFFAGCVEGAQEEIQGMPEAVVHSLCACMTDGYRQRVREVEDPGEPSVEQLDRCAQWATEHPIPEDGSTPFGRPGSNSVMVMGLYTRCAQQFDAELPQEVVLYMCSCTTDAIMAREGQPTEADQAVCAITSEHWARHHTHMPVERARTAAGLGR